MGNQMTWNYAVWGCPDISGRSYKILQRMAAACIDYGSLDPVYPPGLYFAGWKSLTLVIGYEPRDSDDELPGHVERTIGRAIKELRDNGYVIVADKKIQRQFGHRAYWLPDIDITKPRVRTPGV